ncbi:MAG: hypothetical protein ACOCWM_01375 [Cyclobacteriaceae bacterium]
MIKSYSDWFKVDLHIHTDHSNQTKPNDYNGRFNIQKLKDKLIENDVKLFSLTDHNIISIKAYEDYYNRYKEGDPVLLVGCEFDIKVKQDDSSFLTYHTLLIFNENTTEKAKELSEIIESHFKKNDVANDKRSLSVDNIFELFNMYHFFYIPHASGHKNIIDAYKGTDIRKAQEMVLLMECAHEKVKEKHRHKHQQGFDKLKDPEFRNKKDEAFINFSDNHNCHTYPLPKNGQTHEFYCLKGEPTFETLRFAFIDPQSRIKKQTDVDKLKNVKKHISSLKISEVENVEDCMLEFSPNLNVIIGGASSGKSLLFNLIGKKIENIKNGFEKYNKNDTEVLIKASNSHTFQNELTFNNEEVIYINQGDVVKYFEKGDLKELITDAEKQEEYSKSRKSFQEQKNVLLTNIEKFVNRFDNLNTSYHKDFIINEKDFNNMLGDKFHFNEIEPEHDSVNFSEKRDLLDQLTNSIYLLKSDKVFEFSDEEKNTIEQFKMLLVEKQRLIQNKRLTQESKEKFIEKVEEIIEEKNSNLESTSRAKTEAFRRKKSLINTCSTLFKDAVDFYYYSEILQNYCYEDNIEIDIDESVALIIEIENDINLVEKIIKGIKDGDSSALIYDNYLSLVKDNSKLKHYSHYTVHQLLQKLKKELQEILEKFESPKTFLDYGENGNSKNKSPGFNAEMYLKTIIQQENCKLVMIDQPEDNLGNSFKNEDLIDLLREFKFVKQIILVTHNPSIVVYGDAENILLAENDNGQISYRQLVLENKEYQKMIIDNLDGGKAIFDMRSRKYNIKKLLNS